MFPSSGYFRGVNCPYFASGLCDRPFCHFRHSRPHEEKPKENLTSSSTKSGPSYSFNSSQISGFSASPYLSKGVSGYLDSYSTKEDPNQSSSQDSYVTSKESCTTTNANNSLCPIPSFSKSQSVLPESEPEPQINRQSLPKISGLARRRSNAPPSYNPTPKLPTELNDDNDTIPSYHPTPKHSSISGNGEGGQGKKSVIQYDPVKNYAVNPKQYPSSDDESEPKECDTSQEAEFSADEADIEDSKKGKNDHNHIDKTDDHNKTESTKQSSIPSYANLLTPSSYFTSKLSSLSSSHSKDDDESAISCQSHADSDSSSGGRQNGAVDKKSSSSNRKSESKSSHRSDSKSSHHSSSSKSSPSSKSKSSSRRDSTSSSKEKKDSKSHAPSSSSSTSSKSSSKSSSSSTSLSSSKSKSSTHLHNDDRGSKSQSKHSSSESKGKSNHDNDSNSSHSKQSDTSSSSSRKDKSHSETSVKKSHSSSKHSDSSSSGSKHSGANNSKSSHDNCSKQISSGAKEKSVPEKENNHTKHISKTSHSSTPPRSSSSSSSSLSSSHSSRELTKSSSHSDHSKHKHSNSVSSDKKISRSMSSNVEVKKSQHNDIIKLKEERRSSLDTKTVQSTSHHSHADKGKISHSSSSNSSSSSKSISHEKERRKSHDNSHSSSRKDTVKTEIKTEKGAKISNKRRISNITSDLFGEESDGSDDSDVQIIEPPAQPAPEVVELSDSGEEEEEEDHIGMGLLNDEDFNFSDTDTFDECLRIFQETDRKLKVQKRPAPSDTLKEREPSNHIADTDDCHSVPGNSGKKRMAHPSAQQVVRPFKAPTSNKPRLSPAEVMHNRIIEMQKRALLRAAKREGREADLPRTFKNDSTTSATTNSSSTANHHHKPSLLRGNSSGNSSMNSGISSGSNSSKNKPSPMAIAASASSLLSSGKKREAHLPTTPTKIMSTSSKSSVWSPNSFYTKKRPHQSMTSSLGGGNQGTSSSSNMVTIAGTASKTEKRKAHVPTSLNLKRPLIAAGDSSKVPINVRQRYLNLIIDEFLKFCQEETAFQKGQDEEQEVYKRATNKNIYLRVAVNAIKRIRTEAAKSQPSSSKKAKLDLSAMASRGVSQSHEAQLGGSRAAKTSFTLNRSGPNRTLVDFKGAELYSRLKKHIMTEDQLKENNYPRPSEDGSSKAKYYGSKVQKDTLSKDDERLCRRCGKRYYVKEDGSPVTFQECIYHYSNLYQKKIAGSLDSRYGCCSERAGAKGCQVANTHVNEKNKYDNLTGYMTSLPASESDPKNTKVLSLDCEMIYTKAGLELARVTVIGDECQVLYETLVKPDSDIIDYNTRFSGITAKDMKGVETTLRGVQAVMLSMISDKTILMGHSLESDLTALKMIHSTVVDTSLVFPHRRGLPYKRALRNLMVDHLQKIIQADDGGHDSKEDAISCMQLMIYKVKQEAKTRRF